MSKNTIYFRRKALKDCDPNQLSACIKFCWAHISGKNRRWAKRKLFKITNTLAKKTIKKIEEQDKTHLEGSK